MIDTVYDELDLDDKDFFNRLGQLGLIKLKLMKKFPEIFDFLNIIFTEESPEITDEIDKMRIKLIEDSKVIYADIDYTKFRDDIDVKKAIDIINWTIYGFSEEERKKIDTFDNIDEKQLKEWETYSNMLKSCFYKK